VSVCMDCVNANTGKNDNNNKTGILCTVGKFNKIGVTTAALTM